MGLELMMEPPKDVRLMEGFMFLVYLMNTRCKKTSFFFLIQCSDTMKIRSENRKLLVSS